METMKRCLSGRHTTGEIRWHLAALAIIYWGLVLCAYLGYTSEHKYSVMSHTLSALGSFDKQHNPQWFWLFSVAMVYCGLIMMPVILYIRRSLMSVSEFGAWVGCVCFLVGSLAIALTGIFPDARGHTIHGWSFRDVHKVTAVSIGIFFAVGIIWYGALLFKDRMTRKTFAGYGSHPYLKLVGPFLVCLPIFATVGYKTEWSSVRAAITSATQSSMDDVRANLFNAFHGLERFPLLEHVAIWALTIFIIWFAASLPSEQAECEEG